MKNALSSCQIAGGRTRLRAALIAAPCLAILVFLGCVRSPMQTGASAAMSAASSAAFDGTILLGCPTDTSVRLNVLSASQTGAVSVVIGTASGNYDKRVDGGTLAADEPLDITVDGLVADTQYVGQLTLLGDEKQVFATGKEFTFHTARAAGSAFTFCIQGDSHPERVGKEFAPDLYVRTLESAAADQPDFYMTIGDDFSVDQLKTVNAETVRALYVAQRQWLGLVGSPVFLVNGNHEQAALANFDGTPNNVAVWAQTARNAYYPEPAPDGFYSGDEEPVPFIGPLRDYYAFAWGDALFVVIDFYWHSQSVVDNAFGAGHAAKQDRSLWDVTLGDAQYQWLSRTLATSSAKYKFVFAHHVLGTGRGGIEEAGSYEWGDAAELAVHRSAWTKTIQQLLADNHVTIFFQGHDHIFVRQELDDVIYQTLPEPADPNDSLFNADAYLSGDKLPNSGHVRVAVATDGVRVDYVRSYLDRPDEVAFSYFIEAGAATADGSLADGENGAPHPMDEASAAVVSAILGRPTANSVTLSLLSEANCEVSVAYAAVSSGTEQRTAPVLLRAGEPEDVEIGGLAADTAYTYRIIVAGAPFPEHAFHTQRAPGDVFSFTIDADPHYGDPNVSGELYRTTLGNVVADHPDFHIDLGDTFMTEKLRPRSCAEAEASFSGMRSYLDVLGADVPLFLVNGNHEGELGWLLSSSPDGSLPVWSTQLRQEYFPNPIPNGFYTGSSTVDPYLERIRDGYYSWTWGDALFVVLDPFWYTHTKPGPGGGDENWDWTLGKEQYDWLRTTLESSDARFKFIFVHHLVGGGPEARGGVEWAGFYEWGGRDADGTYGFDQHRPGWGEPTHQLLVENGVSAVFHGHDHLFVKQDLDGVIYQEVPQPSMTGAAAAQMAADYGYSHGVILGSPGHLRVTVTPEQATVEYVRAYLQQDGTPGQQNRRVDYSYVIQ